MIEEPDDARLSRWTRGIKIAAVVVWGASAIGLAVWFVLKGRL